MINKKNIGIIGCGWLGKPLSERLSTSFNVLCFSRDKTWEDPLFWQSDTIIIAIHTKENYLETLKRVLLLSKPSSNLILLSSTSAYREFDTDVDESVEINQPSLIKEAEDLLLNQRDSVLILRLGGLMGEDRIAGKWKSATDFTDGFVNYIHRDDVINIIEIMINKELNNGIFNLVAPNHPLRSQIHEKNTKKFDSAIGKFSGMSKRRVISKKVIKELSYTFLYPDPLYFWG